MFLPGGAPQTGRDSHEEHVRHHHPVRHHVHRLHSGACATLQVRELRFVICSYTFYQSVVPITVTRAAFYNLFLHFLSICRSNHSCKSCVL